MDIKDILFSPVTIKERTVSNRFTAQAMEGNDGGGGRPSERTLDRYRNLARGGWGLVISEALSVSETSLARVNGMILNKKNLDGFKRLVEIFKNENPGGLLFFQLTHAGERSGAFSERVSLSGGECRILSTDEIEGIKNSFIEAAFLAEEAGADGIDFKMCHGYLGAEMLRPSNIRGDRWGGSFENRSRFLREGVEAIRQKRRSENFILGSRLSMYEGIRGGCGTGGPEELIEDLAEMLDVVRLMDDLGMDYVNVSAGIPALTGAITRPTETSKYLAYHHLRYTKTVKDLIRGENRGLKVIGSAYSSYKAEAPAMMGEMLGKGYTDLCGFGRQIFADPMTPGKYRNGEKVNWCVLCSGCSRLMAAQLNDGCVVYNDYYKSVMKNSKVPPSPPVLP
jgi:2,4-dienoyl-CoA reductase-like NADH-dependent reductase (Old Yellow Enzyme family)